MTIAVVGGPASAMDGVVTLTGAGSVTLRFNQAGNTNFEAAPPVEATFAVGKGSGTVVFGNLVQLFDGTPKPVTVVTNPAGLTVTIDYDGGATAPTEVGAYLVSATIVSDDYQGTATAQLTISPVVAEASASIVSAGEPLRLTSTVAIEGPATYQWQIRRSAAVAASSRSLADADWVDIPGATDADLVLPSAQRYDEAEYRVVVTVDGVETASPPLMVAVAVPPDGNSRLLNVSTRALVQTGDGVLIPGFVIAGTGPKRLLIRAVGPTLNDAPINFGGDTLPDPRMVLKRHNFDTGLDEDVATNDNWGTNANAMDIATTASDLGAFPFTQGNEAALLLDLEPGQYTVIADDTTEASGVAIVELYDADADSTSSRLVNISNRGFVGTGDGVMIPGFVVSSEGPRTLLIRAVGPTLAEAPFNVAGVMEDPKLVVYERDLLDGSEHEILTQDNWGDSPDYIYTAEVAAQVSAFALADGSADAAFVVTLPPGVYSVVGSGADGVGTGVVLVEVYLVE